MVDVGLARPHRHGLVDKHTVTEPERTAKREGERGKNLEHRALGLGKKERRGVGKKLTKR
jgi:hypothetical protein